MKIERTISAIIYYGKGINVFRYKNVFWQAKYI